MASILRVMDSVAVSLSIVLGLLLLEPFSESSGGQGYFWRIALSLALITVGVVSLVYLRTLSQIRSIRESVEAAPSITKRSQMRSWGSKCPKPTLPSGPIHVLREVKVEKTYKKKRPCTDAKAPRQEGSFAVSSVPETIAAIWETVPGTNESNIWSIT